MLSLVFPKHLTRLMSHTYHHNGNSKKTSVEKRVLRQRVRQAINARKQQQQQQQQHIAIAVVNSVLTAAARTTKESPKARRVVLNRALDRKDKFAGRFDDDPENPEGWDEGAGE